MPSQQLALPIPAPCVSAAGTLLLHKPISEVMRVLSPGPPSGSSVSAGSWVLKARAPRAPLSGALLWGCSSFLTPAASLGRAVASLDASFLPTVFLPCKRGCVRPGCGADHAP